MKHHSNHKARIDNPKNKNNYLAIGLIILAPSVRLMAPSLNTVILFVLVPVLFIWKIVTDRQALNRNCIKYYFTLIGWLLITVFTSSDVQMSIVYMKTLGGGLLVSFIMYAIALEKLQNGIYILFSYILLLVTTLWYLWANGELVGVDISSERLNDELVNANDIAYYLFYTASSLTLLSFFFRGKRFWKIGLQVLILLLTIVVARITASRQMLIIVVPYIIICIIYQSSDRIKIQNILPTIATIFVILAMFGPMIKEFFAGSYMEERMGTDLSEDSRLGLLLESIRVGLNNPIFGVGPGTLVKYTSGSGFSHNSYAELFSTSGLPALLIYLFMTIPFVIRNKRRYRTTRLPVFSFLFVTSVVWTIYNFLYVFYSNLWLISFYYLLMGISDSVYCKYKIIEEGRNIDENQIVSDR